MIGFFARSLAAQQGSWGTWILKERMRLALPVPNEVSQKYLACSSIFSR